jgi:hypothetical protein
MSNNIYDILKKMQNLEAPKQALTESKKAKPDFLDMDKDGDKKEPMKKAAREKSKGAVAEAVATVERQLAEKYTGYKKLGEETQQWQSVKQGAKDVADFAQGLATMATGGKLRSIDQQMADAERAKQATVDRAAAEQGYKVGTKYHNQLIKTNPAYREEFMSLAKDAPMGQLRNIQNRLQLKYDPMGGPMDESAVEESGLQAYLGKKKYGEQGMKALQQAGRDGASKEKMAQIRAQHDKMDEGSYNEDMLSPGQKKIASMAGDPDKIDAKDFAALRGQKKGVKKEGNRFTAGLANDDIKVGEKIPGTNATKTKDIDEGWFDDAADRAIANVNARTAKDLSDERRRTIVDPTHGTPNIEKFEKDLAASRARGSKFYDTPEEQGPFKGRYPSDILRKDAEERDIEGQNKYRDRTSSGIINKAKDFIGYDKPDSAYAPKTMREGWEEMQKYLEKKRGPESKGDAGKKAGTRYGGSAQKDDDEATDGEGQAVVKKKGRPKGTGGGAKFSFKKPKD